MINIINGKNGAFSIVTNEPAIVDGLFRLFKRFGKIRKADVYKVLGLPTVYEDYRIGWLSDGLPHIEYETFADHVSIDFDEPVGFFNLDDYSHVPDGKAAVTIADILHTAGASDKLNMDDYITVPDERGKIEVVVNSMYPVKVYYSGPVTTAIWPDGTKTHVRIYGDKMEEHDPEKALAMVVLKKQLGGHLFRKLFKDFSEDPKTTKSKRTGNSEPTPEYAKVMSDLMDDIRGI